MKNERIKNKNKIKTLWYKRAPVLSFIFLSSINNMLLEIEIKLVQPK